MAVKTEQIEKNLVKLVFEVSSEEFEKASNQVYLKNKSKYSIPGYRKGKVPKVILEKFYSPAIFYDEAVNIVLPDAYEAAVKEAGIEVAARPEIDIEGDIKKGDPVVFTALITTKPEVELGDYKGIETEKVEYKVGKKEVDAAVEADREKNARIITVEDRPVQKGDIAVIDFEGFVDDVAFEGGKGEDYELEIGSNTFIPGFEDQLIGAENGADVDVNVTFPEEYHAEELKGKPALFKVKVKEIKVRELPELDDDFASEVSDFETLKEYKKSIKEKLTAEAEEKAKNEMESKILEKAVENATVDIPEAMLDEAVERQVQQFSQRLQYQGMSLDMYLGYMGSTLDQFKENIRPQAEKETKNTLVIEAIMNKEGIEVGDGELELNLVDMAKKYNMETDKLKELISEDEMDNIRKDMAMQKTIEMIVNNAVVKEAEEKPKKTTKKKAESAE